MHDEENYCPICGKAFCGPHRCAEETLRAIDAAHKRDPDGVLLRRRPWAQRLAAGFDMLRQGGGWG